MPPDFRPEALPAAHHLYCQLTGQSLRLGLDRERQWYEWLRAGFTLQRRPGVEIGELARDGLVTPHIEKPDEFAIRGKEERDAITIPVARAVEGAGRIALGLLQHILRIHRHLLGFIDAEEFAVDEKTIVRRAVGGGNLGDGVASEFGGIEAVVPGDDLPRGIERAQFRVNPLFPGQPFSLIATGRHGGECADVSGAVTDLFASAFEPKSA